MQVLANGRRLGHGLDRLGSEVFRVGAGEAHPSDAVDGPDGPQQLGEQRPPARDVPAIGVDVLAEERDLHDAVRRQAPDLSHQFVEGPADLPATDGGDDAEGALVVAADLDRHPRRVGQVADGQGGREVVVLTRRLFPDLDDRPGGGRLAQQGGGPPDVVGPEHDVHLGRPLADEVPVLLGQAAGDGDLEIGAAVLQRLEVAEVAVQPVVGVLSDAAGVQEDDVGRLHIVGRLHAVVCELGGQTLGVVLVHLTPEGADEVLLGHERSGY